MQTALAITFASLRSAIPLDGETSDGDCLTLCVGIPWDLRP